MSETSLDSAVAIQRRYYAETAKQYDRVHGMDREHNLALECVHTRMNAGGMKSILDVGCGTGRGVSFLWQRGIDVTGVEPVRELLDVGCSQNDVPSERMLEGTGEALPFDDDYFDAVMELGVLHHVPEPQRVVAEMIRVSRRAIFISDCNRFGQGGFVARLAKLAAWKLGLWDAVDFIRTRGKGYTISEEDGLAYSYSVYDSFDQLAAWADHIEVVPTSEMTAHSWLHPLLNCSHVLLIATKGRELTVDSRQSSDISQHP